MAKFSIDIVGTEEMVLVQTISGSISILENKDARFGTCVGTYEKVGSTYKVKVSTCGYAVPLEETFNTVVDAANACLQAFYAQRALLMFCKLASYVYPAVVAAKQEADANAAAVVAAAAKQEAQVLELGTAVVAVSNYRYIANERTIGCFAGGIYANECLHNGTAAAVKIASVIAAIDGTYTYVIGGNSQAFMNAEDGLGENQYFATAEQAANAAILHIKG